MRVLYILLKNWQKELTRKSKKARLRIFQGTDKEALPEVNKLVDMYNETQQEIASKEELIIKLQNTIKSYEESIIPPSLMVEIKVNYPEVAAIKMGRMVYSDFNGHEKFAEPNFFISWQPTVSDSLIEKRSLQLKTWLSLRFQGDTVNVSSLGTLPIDVNLDTVLNK